MRKPSALKRLEGTWRADRAVKNEAQVPAAPIRCPLDLPPKARLWWRRVCHPLIRAGLLTVCDLAAARDIAVCAARLAEAEALIEVQGLTIMGARPDRGMVKNPLVSVASMYRKDLRRWAVQFGMTPASRAGIEGPAPTRPLDPFLAYMGKGKVLRAAVEIRDEEVADGS